MNRSARVLGIAAPPIAVVTVLVAGAVSPGYDPLLRTVSRLAVPGMPAGSPGMEMGGHTDRYDVLAFDRNGKSWVYASR